MINNVEKWKNRLETIREIAIRNEMSFTDVSKIYTGYYCKVYKRNSKKDKLPYGHPDLEERIYLLTEKYIDIQKIRKLNEDFPFCMKSQTGSRYVE